MPEELPKNNQSQNSEPEIYTIPTEFYGAVGHKPVPKPTASLPLVYPTASSALAPAPSAPTAPKSKVDFKSPKFIIIVTGIFLILAIAVFTYYYLRQAQLAKEKLSQPPAQVVVIPPATPVTIPEPTSPPVEVPTSTPPAVIEPVVTTPLVIFPFRNYSLTKDSDNDDLTDKEEAIFGTDFQKPDTDEDGFIDGLEVSSLYNPLGYKPVKLLDSGKVKIYLNPTYNYSIYYPNPFIAQSLDVNNEAVMFSSDTGEFAEVSVVDNVLKMPVIDWYLAQSPGVQTGDLKPFVTKEKAEGILSPDGLTVYVPFEDKIFIINYNIGLKTEINFLNTFKMMVSSFRINGLLEEINSVTATSSATGTSTQ